MFKKKVIFVLCLLSLIFNNPAYSNEKINAERINNMLYDTILREGSFGNLDINVKPCSRTSCIGSVSASADNIFVDGVYIESAKAKILNPTLNLVQKNNHIMATSPFSVDLSVTLSQDNINQSLNDNLTQYLKNLKIKLNEGSYMYISFLNPAAEIKNNKVFVTANLYIQGFPDFLQMPVTLETQINIIDKRVVLNDLIISGVNIQSLAEALKKQHITLYDLRETEKKKHVKINRSIIEINDDKITLSGQFTLPANSYKYGLKVR